MKKLVLILSLVIASVITYGQATPANQLRVATMTTDFGVNIPIGTLVYCIATDAYYVCKASTASTMDLTDGAANFTLTTHAAVTIGTANGLSLSGQAISMAAAAAGTTGALTGTDWSTFNNKVTSITAGVGINVAGTTTVPIVKVDTADASILSRQRAANTYLTKGLADGKILIGNTGGTATAVTPSGDWTISNTGASVVSKSTGNFKVNGVLTVTGSANDATPDSILTVADGVVKKSAVTLFQTVANVKTAKVEDFEQAADSIANNRCYFQLAQTPTAGTISVQLNGMNLKPTTQYTIVANKLRLGLAVYKYDQVSISYTY